MRALESEGVAPILCLPFTNTFVLLKSTLKLRLKTPTILFSDRSCGSRILGIARLSDPFAPCSID